MSIFYNFIKEYLGDAVSFKPSSGNGFQQGPYMDSDENIYAMLVLRNSGGLDHAVIYKCDAPVTENLFEEKRGINPKTNNAAENIHCASMFLDGTNLHVVTHIRTNDDTSGPAYEYSIFDTITDLWTLTQETLEVVSSGSARFANIQLRSDGDVLCFYNGNTDNVMGSPFFRAKIGRRETGTWTVDIEVSTAGKDEANMVPGVIQHSDSTNNRMHLFYNYRIGVVTTIHLSTYLNDNTFGVQHKIIDGGASQSSIWQAVSYNDGGTTKIRAVYNDEALGDDAPKVVEFDDADNPTLITRIIGEVAINTTGQQTLSIVFGEDLKKLFFLHINFAVEGRFLVKNESGVGNDVWNITDKFISGSASVFSLNTSITYTLNNLEMGGRVYVRDGELKFAFITDGKNTIDGPPLDERYVAYGEISLERSLVMNPLPFKHIIVR